LGGTIAYCPFTQEVVMHLIGVVAFVIVFPLLVAITTPASAITVFTANLTGSQEAPANASTASGFATFILNDAQTELSVFVTVNGLDFTTFQTPSNPNDDLRNAHIHCCAPPGNDPAVNNAPVRWGFIGNPFNNTNPDDGTTTPFASGVGGTFTGVWNVNEGNTTATSGPINLTNQLPGILAGLSYINFHTVGFPGGEIRGQIIVPEPPAFILLGVGLLVFLMAASRR
jgi:CHRD domain-containing protein